MSDVWNEFCWARTGLMNNRFVLFPGVGSAEWWCKKVVTVWHSLVCFRFFIYLVFPVPVSFAFLSRPLWRNSRSLMCGDKMFRILCVLVSLSLAMPSREYWSGQTLKKGCVEAIEKGCWYSFVCVFFFGTGANTCQGVTNGILILIKKM